MRISPGFINVKIDGKKLTLKELQYHVIDEQREQFVQKIMKINSFYAEQIYDKLPFHDYCKHDLINIFDEHITYPNYSRRMVRYTKYYRKLRANRLIKKRINQHFNQIIKEKLQLQNRREGTNEKSRNHQWT